MCPGLHQQITQSGGLDRPSDHLSAAGVSDQLAQQLVLRSAADNMEQFDWDVRTAARPRRFRSRTPWRGCPGCTGPPRPDASGTAARFRGRRAGSGRACRRETGTWDPSGSNGGPPAGSAAGLGEHLVEVDVPALQFPGAHGLRQQPQPHDVPQVPDGAVDAAFVGEVRRPALLGQHRLVQFDADQTPGPAGDVGEVRVSAPARRRQRRRCRAIRPSSPCSGRCTPVSSTTSSVSSPSTVPGGTTRGRRPAGRPRARSCPPTKDRSGHPAGRWWTHWSPRRPAPRSTSSRAGPGSAAPEHRVGGASGSAANW